MAQRQIRGGLSAILRNRRRGAKLDWSVSRLLQRTTTSFEPRRPHPGSSLLRSSSAPRGGLTPAEAPLIDAEFLYRQPGPVQLQQYLNERVVKCGVSGYGTMQEYIKAQHVLAQLPRPKLLIVSYFGNDAIDD